jgi:hypothetical protein
MKNILFTDKKLQVLIVFSLEETYLIYYNKHRDIFYIFNIIIYFI